jgi:hypothetical protein
MRSYARIGPPAWAAITDDRGKLRSRIRDEDFNYLDYQVRSWQDGLPKVLQPDAITSPGRITEEESVIDSTSRATQFLRFILVLRASQFKIVILRPLLFSTQSVKANMKRVKAVAEMARESIDTIARMNADHDLYRRQQPILNVFLSSAISTLVLIYVHCLRNDPADCVSIARAGINTGLELLQLYAHCRSSQRLWKKLAGRNGMLGRLGFAQVYDEVAAATTRSVSSDPSPGTSSSAYMPDDLSSYFWANLCAPNYANYPDANIQFNENLQMEGNVPNLAQIMDLNSYMNCGDNSYMYGSMW